MPFHLRLHATLFETVRLWVESRVEKYVLGALETGKEGTPHHHIWMDTPLSKETIKKQVQAAMAAKGYKGERGKANAYYALISWDNRFGYMTKHGVIAWKGVPDDHPDLKPSLPTLIVADAPGAGTTAAADDAHPASSATPIAYRIQKPRKSTKMKDLFVEHLRLECGYTPECITDDNLDEKTDEIIKLLLYFWKGAFEFKQGKIMIQFAVMTFASEELVEKMALIFQDEYRPHLPWLHGRTSKKYSPYEL